MPTVVRILTYEYESEERMERDMMHWKIVGKYIVTPFDVGSSGMIVTSTVVYNSIEEH